MRRRHKLFGILLAVLISIPIAIFMLALSLHPATPTPAPLSHEQITQLKAHLRQNSPFKRQPSGTKTVTFNEKTLNQGAQVFMATYANIPLRIRLHNGFANVSMSILLPSIPTNIYANIHFKTFYKNQQINIQNITVGHLPVPRFVYDLLLPSVKAFFIDQYPDYFKLISNIKDINFSENELKIRYQWDRKFAHQVKKLSKDLLFTNEEQKRIAFYYEKLGQISRLYLWKPTSVHKVMQPLFQHALKRVELGANPVQENKAILMTLGIMASGVRINYLFKPQKNKYLRHVYYGRLQLSGRRDLMQHFLISAALTVSTNKMLTDTIGLSKEMSDADGGSGFSFADLLADRAGVAFGKMAASEETALLLMKKMVNKNLSPRDFMPSHKDLPEAISKLEFSQKYIDVNNPKYLYLEQEISQRISKLPFYSQL